MGKKTIKLSQTDVKPKQKKRWAGEFDDTEHNETVRNLKD